MMAPPYPYATTILTKHMKALRQSLVDDCSRRRHKSIDRSRRQMDVEMDASGHGALGERPSIGWLQ